MNIHRAAYRWTADELVTALRRHMESQISTALAWGLGLILLIGAMISLAIPFVQIANGLYAELLPYLLVPALAVAWFVVLASNALAIQKAKREFARQPGADQMIEWEVSAKEVKFYQRGLFYTASAWKSFVKVAEAEDGFLLYDQESIFHWLPFRAFESPAAIEEVRAFAQASGVAYKKVGA